jgi:hypothetical protein
MFSHSTGGRYKGSVGYVLKQIWPGQDSEHIRKNIPRVLRVHGFQPTQDPTGFYWMVPDVFPVWGERSYKGTDDDGSQTTGGPVTRVVITQKMRDLYGAIAINRKRKPKEYAELLQWDRKSVSDVAISLSNHGYVKRTGRTGATRYDITDKPLPMKNGNGHHSHGIKVVAPSPSAQHKPVAVTNEERELELVGGELPTPKPQALMIFKLDAGLYQIINGKPVKVEVQEV